MLGSWKRSLAYERGSFDRRGLRSWDTGNLEYLIYLSHKHGIDPWELLEGFFEAEKDNTGRCGSLQIVLRERASDHAVFLFTRGEEIVAQMNMKSMLWKNPTKTKHFYSILVDFAQNSRKLYPPPSSIIELRKGMKNVNLKVKVTEKSEIMFRHSRYNGNPISLCIATVTDLSGSIKLPLWNGQIDSVSVGDEIDVKNAYVKMFQGRLQIVPSRKGGELIMIKPLKTTTTK